MPNLDLSPETLTRIRARNYLGEFAVEALPAGNGGGPVVTTGSAVAPAEERIKVSVNFGHICM